MNGCKNNGEGYSWCPLYVECLRHVDYAAASRIYVERLTKAALDSIRNRRVC